MVNLSKGSSLLLVAAVVLYAITSRAQSASNSCKRSPIIPLASGEQPSPKIVIDPGLAETLASRRVVIIQYCAENVHIVPVFGSSVDVSPRVGRIHVALDEATWVCADASGNPIILQGLSSGTHKLRIDLVDANHHALDHGTITLTFQKRR